MILLALTGKQKVDIPGKEIAYPFFVITAEANAIVKYSVEKSPHRCAPCEFHPSFLSAITDLYF